MQYQSFSNRPLFALATYLKACSVVCSNGFLLEDIAFHKCFRPAIVRTLGHLKADLRPADAHHVAPAATLGNGGLESAQYPDVDGVVQRLQSILNIVQQSCIPLEGEATDILNDHHPASFSTI